ncbi:Hemolysin [Cupriavidus oxalaticus]|uniref:L-ornithine N(alpha)-acyltransferase n=2 Tax=Cupriavidus oxalaticus TaxID=96344 RepID=A0A976G9I1_9BURK|nr:Hemolysin [Cupriavidus oxalaticus]
MDCPSDPHRPRQPASAPADPLREATRPRNGSTGTTGTSGPPDVTEASSPGHGTVTAPHYIASQQFRHQKDILMRDLPTPTQPLFDSLPNGLGGQTARSRLHRQSDKASESPALSVAWARHQDEIVEAQRLRYKVFAEEMGARLTSSVPELDIDMFDGYCDHLIVRDMATLRVVGTYRVLPPHQAKRLGCLYAESEFDLVRLSHLRPKMLELGRSCVHRAYRSGSVIMALWGGLGEYLQRWGIESMLGCASVPMSDGGHYAASLHRLFSERYLAPIEYHAFPRLPLPVEDLNQQLEVEPPALIKGYLRLGAKICGQPAWDPDFNVADFLTLLRVNDMNPRYARHFLGLNQAV